MCTQKRYKYDRFSTQHRHRPYESNSCFFQALKDPRCNIDWDSELAVCENCGALLRPPRFLLLYYRLGFNWQGWVAANVALITSKNYGCNFVSSILMIASAYFVVTNVIPALLASMGGWTEIEIANRTKQEYVFSAKKCIALRNRTVLYHALRGAVAILMAAVSIYALAI